LTNLKGSIFSGVCTLSLEDETHPRLHIFGIGFVYKYVYMCNMSCTSFWIKNQNHLSSHVALNSLKYIRILQKHGCEPLDLGVTTFKTCDPLLLFLEMYTIFAHMIAGTNAYNILGPLRTVS